MDANDPDLKRGGPTFSLIFPTYNAASFVEGTWAAVLRFVREAADSWEILFVCDGCKDGTAERLEKLLPTAAPARVRLVHYGPNRGKGYAVRRGMEEATGQWRIFTDVDLAYGFDDVLRLAATLRAGADVAIASRLHPQSRLVVPPSLQAYAYRRHLQSLVFSAVVRRLLPLTQRDTQAGLKGLSARAVRLILPQLQCNGFGFDCELLVACLKQGLKVAEVPVTMRCESQASTTSLRSMRHMLGELWTIRRSWAGKLNGELAGGTTQGQRQAA